MYSDISYFLLDVRANQSSRAWVPWSIDSFEKYSTFVYFTCIISSHVHIYLLFSFGCPGKQVQSCVSYLKYRFLWKIQHIRVLYMHNIISYTHISVIFLWMFGEPARPRVSSLEYRFLWKYTIFVYFTSNIISYTQISLIFIWMFGRTNTVVREFPEVIDSFENTLSSCTLHLIFAHIHIYLLFSFGCSGEPVRSCVSSLKYRFLWKIQHIRVLYMHNIISYVYICYFLMDVRANRPDRAWVPWSIDSFENTLSSFTLHLISSHVLRYLLFSFGCSGEPVQSCVISLEYWFLWKIQHIRVFYMHNIISCIHISAIFFWMSGQTSPVVRELPEVLIPLKNTAHSCTLHT